MKIRTAIPLAAMLLAAGLRADQIEMQNGDHYAGKVISMTADNIIVQSEVLGKITLPRAKVASINLAATTNSAPPATTNASPQMAAALRTLGANSNVMEMVRHQFLSDAGPEANAKFDELSTGLLSGKFDMEKLRKEAKAAADQIRVLKQSGDVGEPLNSYLAILDNFLRQSAPPIVAGSPSPPSPALSTNSTAGSGPVR